MAKIVIEMTSFIFEDGNTYYFQIYVMITMIYLSMRKSNIKRGMAQIEVNIIN